MNLFRIAIMVFIGVILSGNIGMVHADPKFFTGQGPRGEKYGLNLLAVGLTFHPDGGENEDYPRKLDKNAWWVLQLGGEIQADAYVNKYLLGRYVTSLYRDCADVWSGYFHVGPRLNLPIGDKFTFRIGIGPTFIWRENWSKVVKGYQRDSFFGEANDNTFQTAFIWYGGNLDFEWRLNEKTSLIYSNVPGWPEVITSSFGVRRTF